MSMGANTATLTGPSGMPNAEPLGKRVAVYGRYVGRLDKEEFHRDEHELLMERIVGLGLAGVAVRYIDAPDEVDAHLAVFKSDAGREMSFSLGDIDVVDGNLKRLKPPEDGSERQLKGLLMITGFGPNPWHPTTEAEVV